MKEKLETGAILNPKCQKCSKRDSCNNKTLCAYLIPQKDIEKVCAFSLEGALIAPIVITPEMIQKEIIKKACEINMGIDDATLMGLRK